METVSPPFRITKKGTTGTGTSTTTEEEEDEPVIPAIDKGTRTVTNTHFDSTKRFLIGRAPDHWVVTNGPDFSTLTFTDVYRLFRRSVFDLDQTALVVNRMMCHAPTPEHFRFSSQAMKVLTEENAGGASEFSEAVSFELFYRLFHGELLKTEMDIHYNWDEWSKKTDYSIILSGRKIAVSVTRAMKFNGTFTEQDAFNLLYKKLFGIQMSNRDVMPEDRWEKQILHIMTEHVYIVDLLRSVFSWMYEKTPELIGNTVVLITLTMNAPFLYYNFCAEQSAMTFIHENETTQHVLVNENTFTTPANKDTCRALSFDSATTTEDEEVFFYGFSTKEEAERHGALPIYDDKEEVDTIVAPAAEEMWDAEGLKCGGLGALPKYDAKGVAAKATYYEMTIKAELAKATTKGASTKSGAVSKVSKRAQADGWEVVLDDDLLHPLSALNEIPAGGDSTPLQVYPCQINMQRQEEDATRLHSQSQENPCHIELMNENEYDALEYDPAIPRVNPMLASSTGSSNQATFVPTKEEIIFPPQKLPLLTLFRRTFNKSTTRQALSVATSANELDESFVSYPAIIKPCEEYTPWSFRDQPTTHSASVVPMKPDEIDLGLCGMFGGEEVAVMA